MKSHNNVSGFLPEIAERLLQEMSDCMFVMRMDVQRRFHYVLMNSAAMVASGLNEDAYGATFQDVVVPEESEFLSDQYRKAAIQSQSASFLMTHAGQTGHTLLTVVRGTELYPVYVTGMVRDVTALINAQQELEYLAYHDPLTGVFNRHALKPRFAEAKALVEVQSQFLSIILLDCDNLKPINDTYGHLAGDLLLKEITRRIQKAATQAHTLVRTGGDEFLVMALTTDKGGILELTEKLLDALRYPWVYEQIHLQISMSIGLAIYPIDGLTLDELMFQADKALYISKHNGGNQYTLVRGNKR